MMNGAPTLVTVAYRHGNDLACVTGLLVDVSTMGIEVALENDDKRWTEQEGEVLVVSVVTDSGALGALARALRSGDGSPNVRRFAFASKESALYRWLVSRGDPTAGDGALEVSESN